MVTRPARHRPPTPRAAAPARAAAAIAFGFAVGSVAAAFVGGRSAHAREDAVPGSRFVTARAAALGDAYLPFGDDGAAGLFYNPAALGQIRQQQLEPLNFQFYGGSGYFSSFSLTSPSFYQVTSLSNYLSTLKANPGTYQSVGASVFPNFYARGFAVGMLLQSHLGAQVNPDGTVKYRSTYQLIPTIGTGLRLADGIVRVGYSLQWVNQSSGSFDNIAPSTAPLGYNQNLAEGSALSHNLGIGFTLPYKYLPALNVVARNVGGAHYSSSSLYHFAQNPSGTPADEPMTVDGAVSVQPKLGYGGRVNLSLEYRDMTNTSGIEMLGRLAAGAEFTFRDQFYLRGGWGSGYPSAGVGVRRRGGEFSVSWYSEELGTSYHSQRDARFVLQYQIRPGQAPAAGDTSR